MNNMFRVWNTTLDKYQYDKAIVTDTDGNIQHLYTDIENISNLLIEHCLGAKDKNSKYYYAGDVFQGKTAAYTYILFYDEKTYAWAVEAKNKKDDTSYIAYMKDFGVDFLKECSIIGTIHDKEYK